MPGARERPCAQPGLMAMKRSRLTPSPAPVLLAGILVVAGCVTVPDGLQPVPEVQPGLAEVLEDPERFVGTAVVWGGTVAAVSNLADGTLLEIVARPLGRDQRPASGDRSEGRFRAFFPGFLDPQVHAPLREITVRGTVAGVREDMIGAFAYSFPWVEAASVHLWPLPPPEPVVIYRDPFWDPFWGPWGPYRWHPWHRGWW
jgi:outer membrane lipoprotein